MGLSRVLLAAAALTAAALSVALQLPALAQTGSTADHWQWPLSPEPMVVATFHAPAQRWSPGHRGVDLLGSVAQPVSAIGPGTVSFAGMVAGRGVVVVDHGRLRSTYEPVRTSVRRGDSVSPGQVIGTLEAVRSHCPPEACLHLGVRRDEEYLDPLTLLGPREVRLKPLAEPSTTLDALTGDSGLESPPGMRSQPGAAASPAAERAGDDVARTAALAAAAAIATAAADRTWRRRLTKTPP
jgi:murein DD-endopeptidase MepM/ murein hydrolase activator NlpD